MPAVKQRRLGRILITGGVIVSMAPPDAEVAALNAAAAPAAPIPSMPSGPARRRR